MIRPKWATWAQGCLGVRIQDLLTVLAPSVSIWNGIRIRHYRNFSRFYLPPEAHCLRGVSDYPQVQWFSRRICRVPKGFFLTGGSDSVSQHRLQKEGGLRLRSRCARECSVESSRFSSRLPGAQGEVRPLARWGSAADLGAFVAGTECRHPETRLARCRPGATSRRHAGERSRKSAVSSPSHTALGFLGSRLGDLEGV